jgi:DNA-binding beta-propeller fold protein YncE
MNSPCLADLWATTNPGSSQEHIPQPPYNQVHRLDNDGNLLTGGIPSFSAGLSFPSGIAVSPATGNIYVSSIGAGSIFFYDQATGDPLPPLEGTNPGLFSSLSNDPLAGDDNPAAQPAQLAFGPDGNLYVSEFFGDRVRVYDPITGNRLADAVTGLESAGGLAFAPNGDLLVGDGFAMTAEDTARIVRVHNGVSETFGISDMVFLTSPTSLTFLPNGDLLVTDVLSNYVHRFNSVGMWLSAIPVGPPIPDPLPEGASFPSNSPADMDFDPDGNLIISLGGLTNPPDHRGALLRYDINGNFLETIVDEMEPLGAIAWTFSPDTLGGNYNGAGAIGPADYDKWQADFGKFVAHGNGADGNANGVVDAADYVLWRRAAAAGSGSVAAASVPEPAGLALLCGGLLAIAAAHRRR